MVEYTPTSVHVNIVFAVQQNTLRPQQLKMNLPVAVTGPMLFATVIFVGPLRNTYKSLGCEGKCMHEAMRRHSTRAALWWNERRKGDLLHSSRSSIIGPVGGFRHLVVDLDREKFEEVNALLVQCGEVSILRIELVSILDAFHSDILVRVEICLEVIPEVKIPHIRQVVGFELQTGQSINVEREAASGEWARTRLTS